MSFLRTIADGLLRRPRMESEMSQELRFHLESRAADLERAGLGPAAAQRQAKLEFGSVEGYKEDIRQASGFRFFDELRADLRFAFRTLRRNPGFAAIAILSLALGVGVNLSCFLSLNAMLLHPFPYPHLDRIQTLATARTQSLTERGPVAAADYFDWQRDNRSFENLAAFQVWEANLTGVDHPDHIRGARASAEFFEVLGMNPTQGRTFSAAECEPGKDDVVVVGNDFWRSRMAADPQAVGRTISLSGRKLSVIGVMPEAFNLPLAAEVWAPLALTPEERNQRGVGQLMVIGKLKPGVSPAQAGQEMDAIAHRLEMRYPKTNEQRRVLVASLQDTMKTPGDRFVLVLMGSALFVLLLACTNVASLQLARILNRQREMGVRHALGASVWRIMRQLVTESMVLGLAGGILGLALAAWNLDLTRAAIPTMVYRFVAGLRDMRINSDVAILGVALSLAASVFCLLPAIWQVVRQLTAPDGAEALKAGERSIGTSPLRSRLRGSLVIAEVALAFVLLVGAGLMVGAFQRLLTVNLGYDPNHVLTGQIALSGTGYRQPSAISGFYDQLLAQMHREPGVQAAAAAGGMGAAPSISLDRGAEPPPGGPLPELTAATPEYLDAMRIPLLEGRWISDRDSASSSSVVVLSASVARFYWPASTPIGQHIRLGGPDSPWLTVVGVTGDINDWFFGIPRPAAYLSSRQFPQPFMQVLIRTAQDSPNTASSLRLAAQALDREQPVFDVRTLQEQMYEATSGVRAAARMMTIFAVISLLMAVIGIYSISSFFVAQRTREIGVRMTLGATRTAIVRMVLSQSFVLTATGLSIGLPMAVLLTVGMSKALYQVVAVQPAMFVLVIAVLGSAAALAGYLPARRASRVDPMIALRHD